MEFFENFDQKYFNTRFFDSKNNTEGGRNINNVENVFNKGDDEQEPVKKFIEIIITDAKKSGEGMSNHVVYQVETKTNIKQFRKTDLMVLRRFSDFLGLHSKLCDKYLKVGRIIPPPPEKNILGLTKIKFAEQGATYDDFIEKRKIELERFLRRIAAHPVLSVDIDFIEFLQSGMNIKSVF